MNAVVQASEYRRLSHAVREAGLLKKRPGYYTLKISSNVAILAGSVAGVLILRNSWWQIALAVAMAFAFAQLAFLGHDAGHGQVCRSRRGNNLVGLVHANLLTGFSYGWWLAKHNSHHTHCNREGRDPDIGDGVVAFTPAQAGSRRGVLRLLTKAQAVLFVPLLLLEAVNLHVASVRALRQRGRRSAAIEAALLVVHAAGYVALLASSMDALHAVVFALVNQGVFGLYLGLTFVTNHTGMPVLDEADDLSFVLRQVLTSRNVAGRPALTYVFGGLDRQIEHHLFPSMPRANLRRASALVRPFCHRNAIRYHEQGCLASYREALRHLHRTGRRPAFSIG